MVDRDDWSEARIGDLLSAKGIFSDGDWVESKDQDPDGDVRLIQLADVGDGIYTSKSHRFLTSPKARELACTFLQAGDLLIARMPDPLGRACLFPGDEKPSVTVVDVCIVRTKNDVEHRWMMHTINAPAFRQLVASLQSGSTRKRISRKNLATLPLPLPPLVEQRALVAKIEALFSELDKGVEQLQAVRQQLKRYRQSVLKAAFEGKLTADWRAEQQVAGTLPSADDLLAQIKAERAARYQQQLADWQLALADWESAGGKASGRKKPRRPAKPKDLPPLTSDEPANLPDLPEGWIWMRIGELGQVETGSTPPTEDRSCFGGPWSFYKPTDLNAGPNVLSSADSLSDRGLAQSRFLPAGSVLVTCIGATIGKTGLIHKDGASNQQINAIIPTRSLDSRFIYWQGESRLFQDQILSNASSTTMPILNKARFEQLWMCVCSLAEQQSLMSKIESRFSVLDELEKAVEAGLEQAEALRQSILKKAFEGRLLSKAELAAVRAGPDYEPAEKLLERIRVQREAKEHNRQSRFGRPKGANR